MHEAGVQFNRKVLGILDLVIQNLNAFEDGLVVTNMGHGVDKGFDVQFLFELQVKDFGLVLQLDVNVDVIVGNIGVGAVHCVKAHALHGADQVILALVDAVEAVLAPAHWPLLLLAIHRFVDPLALGAAEAEEALAAFTVVTDIFEVEFAFANDAVLGVDGLLNEILDDRGGGEVQGSVAASILDVHIHAPRQKAL